MMKITIIPSDTNLDKYIKIGAQAFIFGLKDYSVGFNNPLSIETLKEIKNKYSTEIFISLNKNMFNKDLDELEKILVSLDNIGVKGILFYDLSILNIKNRLNLEIDLVWNQTHMVTNYNTCNYYYDKGVKYGVLSSEITLEEINEVSNNTKMQLFTNIIGYQSMAFSRRTLLTNYFKYLNKSVKKTEKVSNMNEEYIIKEEKEGTNFLTGKILNGSVYLNDLNVDYIILNEDMINSDIFLEVVNHVNEIIETKDINKSVIIDKLIGDYRGFFNKKTIYKVKK